MKAKRLPSLLLSTSLLLIAAVRAGAHCDTMNGPVIKDAQAALAAGKVTGVLKWVRPQDEREIKGLFEQVLAVRKQGEPARTLAERYFFESLVRIHRAGEGAPYTGLKPAGHVEPVIAASDKALDQGNVDELIERITKHIAEGIRQRFQTALKTKQHFGDSIEAGRVYVRAYVDFMHYMEGLHVAAEGPTDAHSESSPQASSSPQKEQTDEH
ncbi:MAG: DUF6448 family protein [Sedimentisphaerales bacterium]|jgi:hypothetical protein